MNSPLASIFVLKIAELCNLNCGYCYMYQKGDTSFRTRPKFMSKDVAAAMLRRIASYAQRHCIARITLALHGGEPLLQGRNGYSGFCKKHAESGVSTIFRSSLPHKRTGYYWIWNG